LGSVDDSTLDRRQSYQKTGSDLQHSVSSIASEEDLGFNWDRGSVAASSSNLMSTIHDGSTSDSNESDLDLKWSKIDKESVRRRNAHSDEEKESQDDNTELNLSPASRSTKTSFAKSQKHILYIQMQLSQKTLLDYFDARKKSGTPVGIITSLKMFAHIARGLTHVHEKGLIHRDLKPANCFMDDSAVKIGDFGLSRESSSDSGNTNGDGASEQKDDCFEGDEEITTKVGTSSYASPEQMNGSHYNSSTDIFSLGIILFELCYQMNTGMERFKVFEGIRRQIFPPAWTATVAIEFPSIDQILTQMLSRIPKERPSASDVAVHIESLLNEYTVLSLDHTTAQEGSIFIRIEADDNDGVLARTTKIIQEAASNVTILQYSLKGQESKAIMEFALLIKDADGDGNEENGYHQVSDPISAIVDSESKDIEYDQISDPIGAIVIALGNSTEINLVRKLNAQPTVQCFNEQT